ncbi:MAG: hypothetical protein ACPG8A_13175 [Psychrobium sp.]
MPLPVLLAGAVVGAVLAHDNQKSYLREIDYDRYNPLKPDTGREPSEVLPSAKKVEMVPGSIVCCEVYEAFIHTGVVIDDNTIVELHGSGLIRAVSKNRFLADRSGSHIFIACDRQAQPLVFSLMSESASQDIFNFYDYDLLKANCYRHTWRWLTGEDIAIERFKEFNKKLSQKAGGEIYWDVVV